MRNSLSVAVLLLSCAIIPAANAQQPCPCSNSFEPLMVLSGIGFERSEAARYDAEADTYLISNLGSSGEEGDGFISRVAPDGSVTDLKWIEGGVNGVELDNPLGLFIRGSNVYVADTKSIQVFDRVSGAPSGSIPIPDAVRLNDLTVAEDGTIYVTDSGSDDSPGAVYVVRDGQPRLLAERGENVGRPNGVALLADGTIVYGGRGENIYYRDTAGNLLRHHAMPTGRFDGIIPLQDGTFLIASQDGHNVYHVDQAGDATVVANDIAVPAAIGWDSKRQRLLVPQIALSSLSMYYVPVR
jgi:hypothetical protein